MHSICSLFIWNIIFYFYHHFKKILNNLLWVVIMFFTVAKFNIIMYKIALPIKNIFIKKIKMLAIKFKCKSLSEREKRLMSIVQIKIVCEKESNWFNLVNLYGFLLIWKFKKLYKTKIKIKDCLCTSIFKTLMHKIYTNFLSKITACLKKIRQKI